MSPIRIVIADHHTILRDGLKAFFSLHADLVPVGEASDGHDAIRLVDELRPDVMVLELALPGLTGVEVTERLREESPGCKIVVLSHHQDPPSVLSALRAGAHAYLVKQASGNEVVQAIRAVYRGETYLHPLIAQAVVDYSLRKSGQAMEAELTARERAVLALVGRGMTNLAIAESLNISRKTVDKHRAALLRKLNLPHRADLIRYAIEHGIAPR